MLPNDSTSYNQIAQEVITWLYSEINFDSIEAYYQNIPEDIRDEFFDNLTPILLERIRTWRNASFQRFFESNALATLDEPAIAKLVANLNRYNSASVINQYVKNFPDLTMAKRPGITDQEIAAWCSQYGRVWYFYFYFASLPQYFRSRVYLKSLFNASLTLEQIKEIKKNYELAVYEITEAIEENNYESIVLIPETKTIVKNFFESLGFMPPELTDRMLARASTSWQLLDFLEDFGPAIIAIEKATEEGDSIWSNLPLRLWTNLKTKLNADYLLKTKQPEKVSESTENLIDSLISLLKPEPLLSGAFLARIQDYQKKLSTSQQLSFNELVRNLVLTSPIIAAYIEPVEPDFFLAMLDKKRTFSSRTEFINSLESKIDPEIWPDAQKVMRTLIQLF